MKTLKIIAVLALASFGVNAQDLSPTQVPTEITAVFQKNYPQAKDVEWEMKGELYEVGFEIGRLDHEIRYNSEGKVVKVKKEINANDVPKTITTVIKSKYPNYHIDDVEVTQVNNKTTYKVEIEQLLGKERKLVFDNNGKLLSDLTD